jgi:hypothetical protein
MGVLHVYSTGYVTGRHQGDGQDHNKNVSCVCGQVALFHGVSRRMLQRSYFVTVRVLFDVTMEVCYKRSQPINERIALVCDAVLEVFAPLR